VSHHRTTHPTSQCYITEQHPTTQCHITEQHTQQHSVTSQNTWILQPIVCSQIIAAVEECSSGQYYPDPGSCTTFYICVNGRPIKQTCAPGLMWNQAQTMCDWTFNVRCASSLSLLYEYPRKMHCCQYSVTFTLDVCALTILIPICELLRIQVFWDTALSQDE